MGVDACLEGASKQFLDIMLAHPRGNLGVQQTGCARQLIQQSVDTHVGQNVVIDLGLCAILRKPALATVPCCVHMLEASLVAPANLYSQLGLSVKAGQLRLAS